MIFERAQFNQRNQLQGESAEVYIAALYSLTEHCDYSHLTDQMIRDRLVVGIRDKKVSQHLQLDSALTLEKAKKVIRQKEAVQEQAQELEGESQHDELKALELDQLQKEKGHYLKSHHCGGAKPCFQRQGGARGQLKPPNLQ